GFHASRFFLAGPAGYDAAFSLRTAEVPGLRDIDYRKPVHLLLSGFAMLYELGGPPLPQGEPVKDLEAKFPGIRRLLFESYVRYVFTRYGATYAVAAYCQDRPPRPRYLTCRQADRVITRFIDTLYLAGGTPKPPRTAITPPPIERPARHAPDFTYFSPGFLIPDTGLKPGLGGRADYTVYGDLRFPLQEAPAFINSQSFNDWGNCDGTGRTPRRLGRKGMHYTCKVNGRELVFDESAGRNYSYPWRDNFCEHRRYFAGQCPGGQGHQGVDIRPSSCLMFNRGADRCLPYQQDAVAPADGMILRARKQEALIFFTNTADTHLRIRYMHMSPMRLDAAGMLSGRRVARGATVGTVGNYDGFAGGTTNHLHVDLQVPTAAGWALVNPYMTLVSAYEHLLGARGVEIKPGDPVPVLAPMPPVVGHPNYVRRDEHAATAQDRVTVPAPRPPQADSAIALPRANPRVAIELPKRKPRPHRRRHRRRHRQ
ncbi:MAG TPA: hypothetical protein VE224_12140, partial [Pseudolabrys sp.]|nr:hypothetical protein [Pseudolabrys sp.]